MPRFFCRLRLAALSRRALRAPAAGTKALKPWRRQGIWEAALALLCGNEIPFYYALAGDSMETVFPLTALSVGQQARIVRIEARGELARRIRDMGLGSGMTVSVMGYAPLRDPLALRCAEATIALRRKEARTILVRAD